MYATSGLKTNKQKQKTKKQKTNICHTDSCLTRQRSNWFNLSPERFDVCSGLKTNKQKQKTKQIFARQTVASRDKDQTGSIYLLKELMFVLNYHTFPPSCPPLSHTLDSAWGHTARRICFVFELGIKMSGGADLAWSSRCCCSSIISHPPDVEINPPKTVWGCPSGVDI